MIRSMTGFGRGQDTVNGLSLAVEIKSVNHRYYEYSSRLPRAYGFLDDKLKNYLQQRISRGKVDVYVQIESLETAGSEVVLNAALAESYLTALKELSDRYGVRDDISVTNLSRYPDVLTVRQTALDEDAVWESVRTVTDMALTRFVAMREQEGARLRDDVLSRAATILQAVKAVEERSPQTVKEHMDKVVARMRELLDGAAVDEGRLLTEAAIYADKVAVAEETVRLRSHIDQLHQLLESDEPVGKKLDFLVQEMNRETNTIGSKCNDLQLTRIVVDIKAEIEKIREQIQNIE
ncbi:MAG: YicC family protein [Ruminococcaceae bacterium]|nr:YicC family protein [Oscillospiraceae bacterium]